MQLTSTLPLVSCEFVAVITGTRVGPDSVDAHLVTQVSADGTLVNVCIHHEGEETHKVNLQCKYFKYS